MASGEQTQQLKRTGFSVPRTGPRGLFHLWVAGHGIALLEIHSLACEKHVCYIRRCGGGGTHQVCNVAERVRVPCGCAAFTGERISHCVRPWAPRRDRLGRSGRERGLRAGAPGPLVPRTPCWVCQDVRALTAPSSRPCRGRLCSGHLDGDGDDASPPADSSRRPRCLLRNPQTPPPRGIPEL